MTPSRPPVDRPERRRAPRHWWSDTAWRLRFALTYADWEPLELMLGVHALLWGAWLLGVWSAYRAGQIVAGPMMTNPAYGPMIYVAARVGLPGPVLWGLLALGLGLLVLAGYAASRAAWREWGAFGLGLFWVFASVCYVAADWRTTATISVPVYAVTAFYVYSRIYQGAHVRRVRAAREAQRDAAAIAAVDAARLAPGVPNPEAP